MATPDDRKFRSCQIGYMGAAQWNDLSRGATTGSTGRTGGANAIGLKPLMSGVRTEDEACSQSSTAIGWRRAKAAAAEAKTERHEPGRACGTKRALSPSDIEPEAERCNSRLNKFRNSVPRGALPRRQGMATLAGALRPDANSGCPPGTRRPSSPKPAARDFAHLLRRRSGLKTRLPHQHRTVKRHQPARARAPRTTSATSRSSSRTTARASWFNWFTLYYRYKTVDSYFGTSYYTLDTSSNQPLIKKKKVVLKNDYIHHVVDVYHV
jgi:hypothetical protein